MKNFISLPGGKVINLNAIACIQPTPLARHAATEPQISITFLAVDDPESDWSELPKHFQGKAADALLKALEDAGVDTSSLHKALGLVEAMRGLASG